MRPLSQAECPIRLPMRKRCQGLAEEREGRRGGDGDGEEESQREVGTVGEHGKQKRGEGKQRGGKIEKRNAQLRLKGVEIERWR